MTHCYCNNLDKKVYLSVSIKAVCFLSTTLFFLPVDTFSNFYFMIYFSLKNFRLCFISFFRSIVVAFDKWHFYNFGFKNILSDFDLKLGPWFGKFKRDVTHSNIPPESWTWSTRCNAADFFTVFV